MIYNIVCVCGITLFIEWDAQKRRLEQKNVSDIEDTLVVAFVENRCFTSVRRRVQKQKRWTDLAGSEVTGTKHCRRIVLFSQPFLRKVNPQERNRKDVLIFCIMRNLKTLIQFRPT